MPAAITYAIAALVTCATLVQSWNTCADEYFCDRIRNREPDPSSFVLERFSFTTAPYNVVGNLTRTSDHKTFRLNITAIEGGVLRIKIDDPDARRHSVPEALNGEPARAPMWLLAQEDGLVSVGTGTTTATFNYDPFRISIYVDGNLVNVINQRGQLTYNTETGVDESIALDFRFPGADRAYGIPEHAERLALMTTAPGGRNPYRLYNVDYPAYPISTQEALYGTVGVLYAHGTQGTTGIFWLNSAQTFVDVQSGDGDVNSLFITESGALDFFVLPGPTLQDAVRQYTNLTGPAPLPQYFALGHHQCRWSYMSQEDAETVVAQFDNHNFALDVIWLDIDYTDSFKYFTWNYDTFPNPVAMQQFFNSTGRKLVVIIDPHYKVEEGYFVFDIATANGYFVRNPDGTDFQGECWPGLSSYLDYHNPTGAGWYSSLFGMDEFPDGTDILYVWNDMNEPSVFDTFEKTMPRDLVHYGGWQHRDVHNMYGFTHTVATHNGLLIRYQAGKRPFVLTRSFFAGSQRYTAVWTGDNVASWEHLRISFPMLLTLSLSGISFCGADVGGFDGNVEDELLQRWYQAGAWLPFYRAHSSMYTERREPFLYPEDIQTRIRAALRERYNSLPIWYTLFFEHERYLAPVIRPLAYHYSSDPNTLEMDDQWLVGSNILVHPVAEPGATQVVVYLPGGFGEYWFDIAHNLLYVGAGFTTINVALEDCPVFYRGGSIVVRQNSNGLSSVYTRQEPINIYVFLNNDEFATGTLYIDDYESFNYRNKVYDYFRIEFSNNFIQLQVIDEDAYYGAALQIGSILIYRAPTGLVSAVTNSRKVVQVSYGPDESYLEVKDLNVTLNRDFSIQFQ